MKIHDCQGSYLYERINYTLCCGHKSLPSYNRPSATHYTTSRAAHELVVMGTRAFPDAVTEIIVRDFVTSTRNHSCPFPSSCRSQVHCEFDQLEGTRMDAAIVVISCSRHATCTNSAFTIQKTLIHTKSVYVFLFKLINVLFRSITRRCDDCGGSLPIAVVMIVMRYTRSNV